MQIVGCGHSWASLRGAHLRDMKGAVYGVIRGGLWPLPMEAGLPKAANLYPFNLPYNNRGIQELGTGGSRGSGCLYLSVSPLPPWASHPSPGICVHQWQETHVLITEPPALFVSDRLQ